MKGAQRLIRTLVEGGVDVCFMNPGTSEMHFVAALDDVPEMRAVLGLFEGVATGAADGYGRMARRPAATLLHLGPGLGNGIANLHNARRARTPVVNVVGDHARRHLPFDPPLASDIESLARPVSAWYRASSDPRDLAADALEALSAAWGPPGAVATLVVPADVSWEEAGEDDAAPAFVRGSPRSAAETALSRAAKALRSGEPAALLIGGSVTRRRGLVAAGQVACAAGAKLLCETFPARLERGAGLPEVERLGYLAEFALAQLEGTRHLILVDAPAPVSFFAYPGVRGTPVPDGCEVHLLAGAGDDGPAALEALADMLGADATTSPPPPPWRPARPTGPLTSQAVAAAVGALLPEGAVVSDEANTAGIFLPGATAGAPAHDWLCLTGGAIGQGMPLATGAAVACPGRPVLCLEADGSAMYTIQSLWTQAREGLDVTTVVYNNGAYKILEMELQRVGAEAGGPRAQEMLDLARPDLDFAALARGMGVPASRARTAEEFTDHLEAALSQEGPVLVEAVLDRSQW